MAKQHPTAQHLIASSVGFTIGYLASVMIEGSFGWHSFIAGALGNIIGYYVVHYATS